MVFLKKFSGSTDGRTTEKGGPFCGEIRFGYLILPLEWVKLFGWS